MSDEQFAFTLVAIGLLLSAAFITSNLSQRFGLPSLLLYLGIGLAFGNGGKNDFLFDNPQLVERAAELALGLILFKGGYEFRHHLWSKPKILAEGFVLAFLGTLITALVTATAAKVFLDWTWLQSLLLGSVLCSTDAAAVFSVFASSGLRTSKETMPVLELESSTNDPLAYALVVGLIALIKGSGMGVLGLILMVFKGLILGLLVGSTIGLVMLGLTRLVRQKSGKGELLWLAVLTSALGLAELTGANPLITAFAAGVVLSTRQKVEDEFWGPLVALSEVVLFLLLGLQVFPEVLLTNLPAALLLTLVLVFLSRPIAVMLISNLFQRDLKRSAFVSWAGLRGASPIVFGLLPIIAEVPKAHEIFATVFIVVVVSVLVQGTSLGWMASKLGLVSPSDAGGASSDTRV